MEIYGVHCQAAHIMLGWMLSQRGLLEHKNVCVCACMYACVFEMERLRYMAYIERRRQGGSEIDSGMRVQDKG